MSFNHFDDRGQAIMVDVSAKEPTLRSAIAAAPSSEAAQEAKALLGPAENQGGQIAFRYVAPLSIILAVVFGILYFRDRARGGYKVERLAVTGATTPNSPKLEKTTT